MGSEELCRGDADASVEEWQQVNLHRHAIGTKHVLVLLVLDDYIINDETVEEAQVHTSYADFRAQFSRHGTCHLTAQKRLNGRHMDENNQQEIQSQQTPDGPVDDMF